MSTRLLKTTIRRHFVLLVLACRGVASCHRTVAAEGSSILKTLKAELRSTTILYEEYGVLDGASLRSFVSYVTGSTIAKSSADSSRVPSGVYHDLL
ncbi:hypothetical protein BDQ17DRAFT_1375741 [Cyathus striatus]|nr:hypothetical protein BDQ17DRAFT_1375741 [Cyathus striatus]